MGEYLTETPSIDYMNLYIQENVGELISQSDDDEDYIKRCYMFVRDEIPYSWDIGTNIASKTASKSLMNKTRTCWVKSGLFAVFLRANEIPSGISYQLPTIAEDDSEGHMAHALNTVFIRNKWIRLYA